MFSDLDEIVNYFMDKHGYQPISQKSKERHKHIAEIRNKRSQSVRQIFCLYCKQFHNKVHYCGKKRCFILWDYYLFLKMEGPTQDSVLRPAGYDVDDATDMQFYKSRFDMLTLTNIDADKWNDKWDTEQIKQRTLKKELMRYPFADLLNEKDNKKADTLETGQLIKVDEDISRDAMLEKKINNMFRDVYMKFDISDLTFADVS